VDIHNCISEVSSWLWGVNVSTRDIYYSHLRISIMRIHISNWDLDYMIPTGSSHTSVPNPQYEFQKRKIHFQQFFLYFEFGNCILLNSVLAISKKESLYFQMMAMKLLIPFRTIRVWNYFTKTIERNLKLRNVLNCKVYCARCLHTTKRVISKGKNLFLFCVVH